MSLARRIPAALWRRVRHVFLLMGARRHSLAVLEKRREKRLLVLCYGNIYRSPLVAAVLRESLGPSGFTVRSAGFHQRQDRPCDADYLHLLDSCNIDLHAHRSKLVSREDIEWADLIIIMDRKNWDRLSAFDRTALDKTVWIGALLDGGSVEIEDPYGLDRQQVAEIVQRLVRASRCIAEQLLY